MTDEPDIDDETGKTYEEVASSLGWHPKEEYDGDPDNFVEAEEFVKRGREALPILRENMRKTSAEVEELRKTIEDQKALTERQLAAQRERLEQEYEEKLRQAAESGDVAEFDRLRKEEKPTVNGPSVSPEERRFASENEWYGVDPDMTAVAVARSNQLARDFPNFTVQQNLDKTLAHVKNAFPHKFGKTKSTPPHVESGRRAATQKKEHSYANLPQDAKDACARLIKRGIIKDKDEYVSSYKWED